MSTDLIPFTYNDTPVRTVVVDGEPWFVLADLCAVLGLARSASAVSERPPILDSLGRTQNATIVSEPGMYEVVIRSDKPEAVAFRRWITTEVLPTIRKTGGYCTVKQLTRADLVRMVLKAEEDLAIISAARGRVRPSPSVHARRRQASAAALWLSARQASRRRRPRHAPYRTIRGRQMIVFPAVS